MKLLRTLGVTITVLTLLGISSAQSWTLLTNPAPGPIGPVLQLRDGRILAHEDQGGDAGQWWILTPDIHGSYVNGTWSSGGHMQSGYAPFFFGSQVLLDGKHIAVEGGEYNNGTAVWTTLGSYGTLSGSTITWTANTPPSGWGTIGDAQSIILPNKTYMQANCCTAQNALFNGPNSWTPTGNVKAIRNDESGWTSLSNDKILAVDVQINNNCNGSLKSTEYYDQASGTWSCGPETTVQLWQQADQELGAAVMMYNNKVIQFGGNVVATSVLNVGANVWERGPTPPNNLAQADGPAALEPNGKVLAMLSPGLFQFGACQFLEYNPTSNTLANTVNSPQCPADSSFVGHLMILPTGQIMSTDFDTAIYVYNPASGVVSGVAPTAILSATKFAAGSTNNLVAGIQLNGLSGNNAYGDDYQAETNFPLVRLTNQSTGDVYWALTHDDSTHSIARGTFSTTKFDIPLNVPAGVYNFNVVTNGIPSNTISVRIAGSHS